MTTDKKTILAEVGTALNNDEQPWKIEVKDDSIIGTWKWMDARFFSPTNVSDEEKEYQFIITLKDNGKWKEKEHTLEKTASADVSTGKLSFSKNTSSFKGKSMQKSVSFGVGQDKKDGHIGLVKSSLDTSLIKNATRSYLKDQGWKKAGLFG